MSEPRVARILNGVVVDVVIALLADAIASYPEFECVDVTESIAGPGWSWDGKTFLPPPDPPVTLEDMVNAVQAHLDATARSRSYDGILSLCTYAGSNVLKFKCEGKAGVDWRDAVWSYCYQVLTEVEAGKRPAPTINELIKELPPIGWDT